MTEVVEQEKSPGAVRRGGWWLGGGSLALERREDPQNDRPSQPAGDGQHHQGNQNGSLVGIRRLNQGGGPGHDRHAEADHSAHSEERYCRGIHLILCLVGDVR